MGWIDLTHPLTNGMPVIPGDASPEVIDIQTLERDGCSIQEIRCANHAGTHVDAPLHFLSGGMSVDQIPLHKLVGAAAVLDFSGMESGCRIEWKQLEAALDETGNPGKMLLYTGWDRYFGSKHYFEDFPALSLEAAVGRPVADAKS